MELTNEYLKKKREQRNEVFSNYLKEARKRTGLSIRKLAEKTDVSSAYLSRLENNKVDGMPSRDIINKLYFSLKLPLEEMLEMAGYSTDDVEHTKETTSKTKREFSINDIDLMSQDEFKEFVQYLLRRIYYTDPIHNQEQQADMIINDSKGPIIVQINRYAHIVTYERIKSLRDSMKRYDAKKGVIIANDYFSNLIVDLAIENNIVLWDRSILKDKVLDFY